MNALLSANLKILCLVLLSTLELSAQELSVGAYGGVITYQGDLVEGVVELSEIHPAFGVNVKYLLFKDIAITGNVIYGKISGDDANSEVLTPRGFSFESTLTEASAVVEYHPLGKGRWNKKNEVIKSISPYIFGGVGYVFGEAKVLGLPPESEDPLNNTSSRLVIPFGIGVQATFSEKYYVELLGGSRYVTDDYLDGVSLSGNPAAKDWFITAGIKIGVYLTGEPSMF